LRLEQEQAGKLRKVEVLARSRASMTCPPEPRCGDEADQAIVSITEQLEHLELRRIATSVHTIEAALLLMEQGRYGQCLRCERPIPPRRLQAVPTAILCRTCQESVEEARAACRV
jgi:RNA polymerase-binding transcription factor DksA